MDIQVTFEDGTTEIRPANCPSLASYDATDVHPCQFTKAYVVPARPEPVVGFQHSSRRVYTHAIAAWREGDALVWRITGGRGENEPLTGEWTKCCVETEGEQIERLTWEGAAEKARADAAEMARDEARVALIRILALWGWTADNGGFVSVNDLGKWAITCSIADDIAYRDLLADMRRLRAPTRGDLINARARAGAARVEAEEAAARLKMDDPRRPAAMRRVVVARAEEACAREAEQAASR